RGGEVGESGVRRPERHATHEPCRPLNRAQSAADAAARLRQPKLIAEGTCLRDQRIDAGLVRRPEIEETDIVAVRQADQEVRGHAGAAVEAVQARWRRQEEKKTQST